MQVLASGDQDRTVLRDLGLFLLAVTLAAAMSAVLLHRPLILLQALALAVTLAALVAKRAPVEKHFRGLGPANRVTLVRAAIVTWIAALAFHAPVSSTLLWVLVLAAVVSLILDGIDGLVARRTGSATAFGARFDMELDAFFMLVLSLLVWQSGQTGPWVLLIGLLRYLFVAASLALPALRAPLPPSVRRKTVCVVQAIALILCLAPVTSSDQATAIALIALGLLVYSFSVDCRWLLQSSGSAWRSEHPTPATAHTDHRMRSRAADRVSNLRLPHA